MDSNEADVRKFLVSHQRQAFELIEPENCYEDEFIVRRVPYLFQEDVVSHPVGAMRGDDVRISLPRELADRIVSHLVRSYIDTREYARAAGALSISKAVLRSWWRWYSDRDYDRWLSADVLMGELSRCMALLTTLYDDVYTGEGMGPPLGCHFPTIGLIHPAPERLFDRVQPHDLVDWVLFDRESGVSMSLHEHDGRKIEGMRRAMLMATGPRICDVMVGDEVDVDEGVYSMENVRFPVLFLKIDVGVSKGSDKWEGNRVTWKRFADLVRWSMEGCELYVETTRERLEMRPTLSGSKTGKIVKYKTFVKP